MRIAATFLILAFLLSCSDSTPIGAGDEEPTHTIPVTVIVREPTGDHAGWLLDGTGTIEYAHPGDTETAYFFDLPDTHTFVLDTSEEYCIYVRARICSPASPLLCVSTGGSDCDSGRSPEDTLRFLGYD